MLIDALPPEAQTATAMRVEATRLRDEAADRGEEPAPPAAGPAAGADEHPWSQVAMLLATVVDELRLVRWFYASAHSKEGRRPARPASVERPGVRNRDRRPHATSLTPEQRRRLDPRLRQRDQQAQQEDETAGDG